MKKNVKPVAVILSMFDTGLSAARSLGRHGIPVIGLDPDPNMPGLRSRYCTGRKCPDPVTHPDDLLSFLESQASVLDAPAVLFPASDAFVSFVSDYREQLSRFFRFNIPAKETVDALLNKYGQFLLAQKAGLDIPHTQRLQTVNDFQSARDSIRFPAFIKPSQIHLWRAHFPNKGFRIDNPEGFLKLSEIILPTNQEVVVQEIIPGPVTNNYEVSLYVDTRGQVPYTFTVRKWRQYPTELGVGTLVESVREPSLEEKAIHLCETIGLRGFANVEFKFDARDGKPKYIELNARLWQQNGLADACGLNFPLMQYNELVKMEHPTVREQTTGSKWWDPMSDFQSFVEGYRNGSIGLSDWIGSLKHIQVYGIYTKDDMMPGIRSLEYGLKILKAPWYVWKRKGARRN